MLFENNTENEVCVRERHFHWWARDREVAREPESGCRALLPCPMAHARRHARAVSCARATAAQTAKSFPALQRSTWWRPSPCHHGHGRDAYRPGRGGRFRLCCQFMTFGPVFKVLLWGCSESSRLAQRHPKVFIRYIDVGHGGCDSLARISGKKFVPRVQYATHFSARRSVEHALLLTY